MAWNDMALKATGDIVSASEWNNGVYYNPRYLKGKDGEITIEANYANALGVNSATAARLRLAIGGVNKSQLAQDSNDTYLDFGGTIGRLILRAGYEGSNKATFDANGNLIANGVDLTALKTQADATDVAAGVLNTRVDAATYDYTPVRSLDVVYRNTTGKLLLVTFNISCEGSERVQALVGAANPPTGDTGNIGIDTVTHALLSHTIIVPINYYYKLVTITGTPGINRWVEYTLH